LVDERCKLARIGSLNTVEREGVGERETEKERNREMNQTIF
jgi:hypothetical protein